MSFKPGFGYEIISKQKTCEIRRCFSKLKPGDLVYVYVSSPVKSIIGYYIVDKAYCIDSFNKLEKLVKELNCIFTQRNWNYVVGKYCSSNRILLIKIRDTCRFEEEIGFDELKTINRFFQPPQSYFSLDKYPEIKEYLSRFKCID